MKDCALFIVAMTGKRMCIEYVVVMVSGFALFTFVVTVNVHLILLQ